MILPPPTFSMRLAASCAPTTKAFTVAVKILFIPRGFKRINLVYPPATARPEIIAFEMKKSTLSKSLSISKNSSL